jgi:hypothetical protein
MNDQELKELAEFAAGFSDFETHDWVHFHKDLGRLDHSLVKIFFKHDSSAPLLAHLARREMEKRGFTWNCYSPSKGAHPDDSKYEYEFEEDVQGEGPMKRGCKQHENEYIAMWMAIRKATQ